MRQQDSDFIPVITERIEQIAGVLKNAGYNQKNICRLLKTSEIPTYKEKKKSLPLFLYRTENETAPEILVRLFLFKCSVSSKKFAEVITPTSISDWCDAGLIFEKDSTVTAFVELIPFDEMIFAADWRESSLSEPVMGIAASSKVLGRFCIKKNVNKTLDLGTGGGILSLISAMHSKTVIGIDCNARAVEFARFNSALNGISNTEFLVGDWFAPIAESKFDLIVCNPPFMIAPQGLPVHSASGKRGDNLCREIIRTVPEFLNESGFFQMVFNWIKHFGQDWRERLNNWLVESRCDALLFISHFESADEYAFQRSREMSCEKFESENLFRHWLEYVQSENIEAVGFGILTMRRRSGQENWIRFEQLKGFDEKGASGENIQKLFDLTDVSWTNDDMEFLDLRLRAALQIKLSQELKNFSDGWAVNDFRAESFEGIKHSSEITPQIFDFILKTDGKMSVGDYLKVIAGESFEIQNPSIADFLKTVRRLLEEGILIE